jgi:hypothetical protein
MADWAKTAQRTYEYYTVDPGTWQDVEKLDTVTSSSISWDTSAETLGSASFAITESVGEAYVRIYMITVQNGVREKRPLGTFLLQTPSSKFDGRVRNVTVDAYTPLLELKENPPPLGYFLKEGENIMERAYELVREHARAPVVRASCDKVLPHDFVANTDDTWLSFLIDLIALAEYEFDLDEEGRILFSPIQEIDALQPVWTYSDDNSSILYPDLTADHDLYAVPNVVEVVYTGNAGVYFARVVNDDPNSPVSTIGRGREIVYRDTNPSVSGNPDEKQLAVHVQEYAEKLLKSMSTLTYTLSYSHGYCPVRLRDGVRLNYRRAEVDGVKAKVISQTIDCTPECKVSETAVFSNKLWR